MNGLNFAKLQFIGFFTAAIVLSVVILSSFWGPLPSLTQQESKFMPRPDKAGQMQLETYRLLHAQWTRLEELYIEHSIAIADGSKAANINETGKPLTEAEAAFNITLDSLTEKIYVNGDDMINVDSIISSYRLALENRQYLNNISHVQNNDNNTGDQKKLQALEIELQAKTATIATLQHQLKLTGAVKTTINNNKSDSTSNDQKKLTDLQNDLEEKANMISTLQSQLKSIPKVNSGGTGSTKNIKKMEEEMEFLKWALRSEVSSNHALTKSINQLKQTNARLANQLKEK